MHCALWTHSVTRRHPWHDVVHHTFVHNMLAAGLCYGKPEAAGLAVLLPLLCLTHLAGRSFAQTALDVQAMQGRHTQQQCLHAGTCNEWQLCCSRTASAAPASVPCYV